MKPFEGITVLEFSTMITASLATMMLGEQGARVIKVEPTETGDPLRYIGAAKGGISSIFANCNRGKNRFAWISSLLMAKRSSGKWQPNVMY